MDDGGPTPWAHLISLLPLLGAAVGWYVSSRLAVSAIASHPRASLRRAAAQVLPVLFVAMTAIVRHEPQIAIGVIFGSCVATLSLVLGVVTFSAVPDQIGIDARRRWGFVLPAAVLVFLAGYQTQFTLLHAAVLAAEGIVVLLVLGATRQGEGSREAERAGPAEPVFPPLPPIEDRGEGSRRADTFPARQESRPPAWWLSPILLMFAIVIAAIASWFAVAGAKHLLTNSSLPSMSIIAALLLGPALVIPMIGTDVALSQHGDYTDAVGSQVGFVLLNLCGTLPLVILAWYVEAMMPIHSARDAWDRISDVQRNSPLNFPLIVWRVDCVMLIVLGLALVPISLGRWLPRRAEGLLLIAMYAAYMVLWRWGSEMS